ncbi:MAG: hypothetical protein K9G76_04895 [Bacteroidales bacterium]|nr:hypothetical protein [Bacteroidales bacterium]MCF8403016.1 hypothetical protein [Bacteroidales bacterium]
MKFYSRGKLMISGEYLALKGATVLAVPLNLGQDIFILNTTNQSELIWESNVKGEPWFKAKFSTPFIETIETTDKQVSLRLRDLIKASIRMNPGFTKKLRGIKVISNLEFDLNWGFGSSSSLISNLAYWAEVDPYSLHKKVSKGSGYDVIAARQEGPFHFKKTRDGYQAENVNISEQVTRYLYFVYLGQKKDSSKGVNEFLKSRKKFRKEIQWISDLSMHLANSEHIDDFGFYMKEHEQIISSILHEKGIMETIFKDFTGEAKSLGAWGGDFAMLAWTGSKKELKKNLLKKNLKTIFSFDEIVKIV